MKCIKFYFLLPQKNDFKMLWKHFIIKMCSCRRRDEMLPSLLGTGTVWEETGAKQAVFRHCVSIMVCALSLTQTRDYMRVTKKMWMLNCTANANLSMVSLWQEHAKDNSYCQVLLLRDYHSTFLFSVAAWTMINLTTFPFQKTCYTGFYLNFS